MQNFHISILATFITAFCACHDTSPVNDASHDAPTTEQKPQSESTTPTIGKDWTLTLFKDAHLFWTGSDAEKNQRSHDVTVTFPPLDHQYDQITLAFALRCPNNKCDYWDRLGSLGIVRDAGTPQESVLEISRFITPYRVGAAWQVDLTDLRPLLVGDVTFRVFIDTWVGPGSAYGEGWLMDASVVLHGGVVARPVQFVIPVWPPSQVVYGDPNRSVVSQLPDRVLTLPAGALPSTAPPMRLALRALITGHGQGNKDNCAEFCAKEHRFHIAAGHAGDNGEVTVDGERANLESVIYRRTIWRDDCARTAAPHQWGTWQASRAGWCPGAQVEPWLIDIAHDAMQTLQSNANAPITIHYEVAADINTCRPDAIPCAGCALGNGCAWNDSNHTEPYYQVSALLIGYAAAP